MNDEHVIDRLRSALDEVSADAGSELAPFRPTAAPPRRWIGIAAATLLLAGGAVWALSTRDAAEPPVATDATIATPTVPPTTAAPAPHDGPWFELHMAGLEPSADPTRSATAELGDPKLFQAWEVRNGDVLGLLTVTISADGSAPTLDSPEFTGEPIVPLPEGDGTLLRPVDDRGYGYEFVWHRADGSAWWFQSAGLSWELVVKAVIGAVPGSGIPIVIPDPTLTLLSVGALTGESISQTYGTTAIVTVVADASTIAELMGAANVVETTVAGHAGYAALMDDGTIQVAWDAGEGYWGGLSISAADARGADGIIAAVVPAA